MQVLTPATGSTPYGRPPGFGGFPGQPGGPQGMGAPPGMGRSTCVSLDTQSLILNRSPRNDCARRRSSTWHATAQRSTARSTGWVSSKLSAICEYAEHQLLCACHTLRYYWANKSFNSAWRRFEPEGQQYGIKICTAGTRRWTEHGCTTPSCTRQHDAISTTN